MRLGSGVTVGLRRLARGSLCALRFESSPGCRDPGGTLFSDERNASDRRGTQYHRSRDGIAQDRARARPCPSRVAIALAVTEVR